MYKSILFFVNSTTRSSNAFKQILFTFCLQVISVIIGLLYVPLLLNYLNQEKYGLWLTLTSILGWFSFFDIGLGNGLRNKLAECFAKGDLSLAKKLVSTTYAMLTLIFMSILFIFHILNHFLNWSKILNSHSLTNSELFFLTSIVFSFFLLRFIFQLIAVVYTADQKSSINGIANTVSNIISFFSIYVLLKMNVESNLIVLGAILSSVPVFVFIFISIKAFKGIYKSIKPSLRHIDFTISKGLMNLGVSFFFLQVTAIIIFSTSSFFISQLYGSHEVVIYNVVFKYFQVPVMVFSIILSPIWTAVTDAFFKKDFFWLKNTLKRLNILSFFFSFIIVTMIFTSKWVFKIWVGDKLIIPRNLVITMGIYAIMQVLIAPYSNFINGLGKIKLTMTFTFLGILVYFICIYYLSRIFNNSASVVMSIIFTSIIGCIIQPIQVHKILKQSDSGLWSK